MAVDDFVSDDNTAGDSGISSDTSDTTTNSDSTDSTNTNRDTKPPTNSDSDYVTPSDESLSHTSGWTTKLDFSKPYIVVARDRSGETYVSKGSSIVIEDADDWRRLDDHPDKDFNILCQWSTEEHWLNFCHLLHEQFDEDASELLESDVGRLAVLKDDVYWPPGSKPSNARTCRVCGAVSTNDDISIVEIDLHETRQLPVCTNHTVKELAESGFMS